MRNTRADVVSAALRVLDAHGLEFCSMRRVASELGVQPSALYHHVPDKQTLLALMADEIVRDVTAVQHDDPADLCHALREALLAVRDGADVVATASAFRLGASHVEAQLGELVGADGARTLLLYTFGHAQSTQMYRQAAVFGALLHAPGSDAGPFDQAGGPAKDTDADIDASFARGIGIILAGLGGADPGRAR